MTKTQKKLNQLGYKKAVEEAVAAAANYYNSTGLLMSDAEYDGLLIQIKQTEDLHPKWVIAHNLHSTVAGGTSSGGEIKHVEPMLSLDNCFDISELETWLAAHSGSSFTVEPKYDGLSLAATYKDGTLTHIATRGDGTSGENVTYALDRIIGLPKTLGEPLSFEVRGEVIFNETNFEIANSNRMAAGKAAFANPRNAAAGTLRAEKLEYVVTLSFYAHGQVGLDEHVSHSACMSKLAGLGIACGDKGLELRVCASAKKVVELVEKFKNDRETLSVDVDGVVIKIDDYITQKKLGNSSRAPRWGLAFKYPAIEATSILREVEWTVGRTGRITPRATIDPVLVGGTTVTYATLHNAQDIEKKDLMIGDTVLVKRAGEVIPRIEAPLIEKRDGTQKKIKSPTVCPRCGGKINTTDIIWRCVQGRKCGLSESIQYAASRDCLDIEGMGKAVVQQLVDTGAVTSVADIFTLTKEVLSSLDRMGETSADNLIAQIEKARTAPLNKVFCALGVRNTGRSMSRRIAAKFKTMDAIVKATVEELAEIDGIGEDKAATICKDLKELTEVITELAKAGVTMQETTTSVPTPLVGKIFVVTGTMTGQLANKSRQEVLDLIEFAGGKTSSSVSKNTNYLVAGDSAGSKLDKAIALKITVLSPDELAEMLK
jgi:DNA ligase (NAD+)